MRRYLTAGAAALALIGGSAITSAADAQSHVGGGHAAGGWHGGGGGGGGGWHGGGGGWRGGWHGDHDWGGGWGWGAGLAGFALGATLASPYYYGPGYYGYYGPYDGDATCIGHRRYWDPYAGAYVVRSYYYPC